MAHCPLCREPVSRASLLTLPRPHRFSVDLSDASQWRSSAKIDALLAHLRATLPLTLPAAPPAAAAATAAAEAAATGGAAGGGADAEVAAPPMVPVKSVVFSQWSAMLDLVAVALRRAPQARASRNPNPNPNP